MDYDERFFMRPCYESLCDKCGTKKAFRPYSTEDLSKLSFLQDLLKVETFLGLEGKMKTRDLEKEVPEKVGKLKENLQQILKTLNNRLPEEKLFLVEKLEKHLSIAIQDIEEEQSLLGFRDCLNLFFAVL